MKMSTKHCKYGLSFSTSNKLIKLAQAPKSAKKPKHNLHNLTKHWQAPTKRKKQQNLSIYSGFWTPIDCFFLFGACQCFVRLCKLCFCEVVLCFFGVPANVFRASLQNKMQKCAFPPRFQRHQMQKTSVVTVFCAHFHSKIMSPWSPALKKKIKKMTRCPLHGPLLSSGGIWFCGSSLRWSLELCFLTLGMLAMSTAWKIHCKWRCFVWKREKHL